LVTEDVGIPLEQRKPWIAGLLSLAYPGLGQVYNGEPGRGLVAYLAFPALFILSFFFAFGTFSGLVISLTLMVCLYFGITADAVCRALRIREIRPRWYNRPVVYFALAVTLSLLANIVTRTILPLGRYRAYYEPSGSMEPTIHDGDRFIVDTWAYRKQSPLRGDIAIFRFPPDPTRDFVKRCVAVSNDVIAIHDKQLSINGKPVSEPYAVHMDQEVLHDPGLGSMAARDQYGPEKIPPGSFFSLGDNRDNSNDSRFYGSVRDDLLKAKALYVYWSKDRSRIGRPIR
jgi:signal peptidase I